MGIQPLTFFRYTCIFCEFVEFKYSEPLKISNCMVASLNCKIHRKDTKTPTKNLPYK